MAIALLINEHIPSKGTQTRSAILDVALLLAGSNGLEGLTIGLIAERMQMSKSGVFSHFGSREDLQIAVITEYHRRFQEKVFLPSLQKPKGLPRLEKMLTGWMEKTKDELHSGCIFISGAMEFDDRPGPVRDALVYSVQMWRSALLFAIEQAIQEKHFRKDCNPSEILFQIYSLVLGLHHEVRFMRLPDSLKISQQLLKKIIQENCL
ncbi:MAG: TetR/AcrR family transcriptional regulator [Betaproteobacteria bacterium]|jgi:AcrR family transcriptional regulator